MRNARVLIWLALMAIATGGFAQNLNRRVSFHYDNEPLGNVLNEFSTSYHVRFAYSSSIVPMNHPINASGRDMPINRALDNIFEPTPVVYRIIDGQVVLKVDENKDKRTGKIDAIPIPRTIRQTSPIYPQEDVEKQLAKIRKKQRVPEKIQERQTRHVETSAGGNSVREFDPGKFRMPTITEDEETGYFDSDHRLAQISIMPFLSTNLSRTEDIINNVSVNLFWGKNGGVEGVEVGGFFNHITKDVQGVQVAGLGNTVKGEVLGTQVAGLFNVSGGKTQGVQVGGLFNVTSNDFTGVQISGLFNTSSGKADGIQVSGLFNTCKGKTKTQISGLFNVAGNVDGGQISALLNRGKKVKGMQIGLINIADSISGVPIGLINIIRKGYNRFELSGSDALHANFGLKFGAKSFYNMLLFGARWDDLNYTTDDGSGEPETVSGTYMSWGLGYGLGTAITLGSHTLLNLEASAMHINETEDWTSTLNLLNQVKLTLDIRIGRRTSIFAGPVGNLLVSQRKDPETGLIGSSIPSNPLLNETTNGTNVKGWVGFTAGMRF